MRHLVGQFQPEVSPRNSDRRHEKVGVLQLDSARLDVRQIGGYFFELVAVAFQFDSERDAEQTSPIQTIGC